MQRLITIGTLVRPFVVYILLIYTGFVLVLYPAPVWVVASLAAVVAVAVLVLVVDVAIRISIVQRVIQRMVSRRLYEFIFKLSAHIVLLCVLVVGLFILLASTTCPGGWFCSDWAAESAIRAETEIMQSAMNAMMLDRNLTAVDGHTSGPAVNVWTGTLDIYLKQANTKYYYCWDAHGNVYPRSEDPDDAENPGDCPQGP